MNILTATKYIFSQLRRYPLALPEKKYAQPCLYLSDASIGQHVRHPLDFYSCLLRGMEGGEVNYDARERNSHVEQHPAEAKEYLLRIEERLEQACRAGDRSLGLRTSYTLSGSEESVEAMTVMKSFFHRELSYAMDHVVHHMALIRVAWQEVLPGQPLPRTFGVAFSTLRHADTS